jgi:subtilisin
MLENSAGVSRRDVLKATAGSIATVSATGLAAAKPEDTVEINVGFKSERGRSAALDAAEDVVRKFPFDAVTIRAPKKAVTGLENSPQIRYVEANGEMQALAQTLPWGIDRVDAEIAHNNGDTGWGGDVAIIDTGIDSDHPDLQGNLGTGYAATSCSYWYGDCRYAWDDDNGHGTHCAGIAGAIDNSEGVVGVAPDITLHAVKVLNYNGGGSYSDIADGIRWVADQGYDVGSLSLGGGYSSAVYDAVQYAYNRGVTLVAAAGNDGSCTDCVSYPAAHSEVIAVSATSSDDSFASFSSQGPEIELAAPGESIYSTYTGGGYDTLSGTSMACPHVSGAAGALRAAGYGHGSARSRLRNTAENIGLSSNRQGYGLLDVASAFGHWSGDN